MKSVHPSEVLIVARMADGVNNAYDDRYEHLLSRLRSTDQWDAEDIVHVQPVLPVKGGSPRLMLVSGWLIYKAALELQEEVLRKAPNNRQHELLFLQCEMLPSWTDDEYTEEKLGELVLSMRYNNRKHAHYSIVEEVHLASWIAKMELERLHAKGSKLRTVPQLDALIADKEGGGAGTVKYWRRVLRFHYVDEESLRLLSYLEHSSVSSMSCT